MVANVPKSTYDLNFLVNVILICFSCSQIPTLPHTSAHLHRCGASGRVTVRPSERIKKLKNYGSVCPFNFDLDPTILTTTLLEDLNAFLLAGAFLTTFCSCAERRHFCARLRHKLRKHNYTLCLLNSVAQK
jgi:hypothetical protein